MSQLIIKRSKILCSQSADSQLTPSDDNFDDRVFKDELFNPDPDSTIECVFKTSGFLKLLLQSISHNQDRSLSQLNNPEVTAVALKNLFYVHFVFKPEYLMIQSIMDGNSMYTCISISKDHLEKYFFRNEMSTSQGTIDVAVSLQALLVCIGMYSQNHSLQLLYNGDDRQIVLKGNCTDYDKHKFSKDTDQHLICRLKTISAMPLNIPFEDLFFNIDKYDYFTISPKLLHSCLTDISTDAGSTRVILEITPPSQNSNHVLGMTRENSPIIVQWDFSFDKAIFEEFRVTKSHLYKYSTKCMQCVANGLKISNRTKLMIKENGALLIKTYITCNVSDEISLYYYVCPFFDTDTN